MVLDRRNNLVDPKFEIRSDHLGTKLTADESRRGSPTWTTSDQNTEWEFIPEVNHQWSIKSSYTGKYLRSDQTGTVTRDVATALYFFK